MKLLFLADLHIHFPKKVPREWQRNRYMMLSDEINKVDCDLVILGGDTLDSVKPTTAELALFFDFLSKIKHRTLIYSGNHEMQTKTHSILFDLRDEITRCNSLVDVATSTSFIDPETGKPIFDIIDYMDIQKEVTPKSNIAFTHVRGAITPHVIPETELEKFSEYSIVFAGDLHSYQNSQLNIMYPGSPLTTSMHRTRQTDSNGMFLIDFSSSNSIEWINLSHLPQLIKKTVVSKEEIVPTEYDFTMYEIEGSIADLMGMENTDLLDKKVNNVVTKDSKLELKTLSINEQMQLYLKEIQHLPEETISRLIRRFNKYAVNKTNME